MDDASCTRPVDDPATTSENDTRRPAPTTTAVDPVTVADVNAPAILLVVWFDLFLIVFLYKVLRVGPAAVLCLFPAFAAAGFIPVNLSR